MGLNASAPWHRASFDRFLYERLPQLLAERLPLTVYQVEEDGARGCCSVRLGVTGSAGDVETEFRDLPRPDEAGLFTVEGQPMVEPGGALRAGALLATVEGQPMVVLPVTSDSDLAAARIRCVGEQLYD